MNFMNGHSLLYTKLSDRLQENITIFFSSFGRISCFVFQLTILKGDGKGKGGGEMWC